MLVLNMRMAEIDIAAAWSRITEAVDKAESKWKRELEQQATHVDAVNV